MDMRVPVTITQKADYSAMQDELTAIKAEMKRLNKRRSALNAALKHRVRKEKEYEYRDLHIWLYVLELEDGCYYIGMTRNIKKRFKAHTKGKGAVWTKKHAPISIIESRNTYSTDDMAVAKLEDDLTLDYARMYGTEVVRGGGYCQTRPKWPKVVLDAARDAEILARIREFV